MSINIQRDNDDPFYRYKMPPIRSKTEGRGNGIKTAVMNTSDVARALSRPPSYIIKYFGFELGAQTSINDALDRYLVNGAHDSGKLQDSLDGFITKFVLCGSCKNPETDYIIHKDGTIDKDCKACGSKSRVDPGHKLTGFIVKNPPQASKSKKKAMANAGASTGGNDDTNGDVSVDGTGSNEEEEGRDDDELTRRINAEAAALPSMASEKNDDEVEWAADLSEAAVKARQKKLEKTMSVLKIEDDSTSDKVYDDFGEWILAESPSDVEIYKRATELNIIGKAKTVQVLAQTLFTENLIEELPKHVGLLGKIVTSPDHENALLGGLERFIGLSHPELVKSVPNCLFKLYEADLISEDVVTRWGSKASRRYVPKEVSKTVRKAAKPFLDWLEEAESDSDSDSDSE